MLFAHNNHFNKHETNKESEKRKVKNRREREKALESKKKKHTRNSELVVKQKTKLSMRGTMECNVQQKKKTKTLNPRARKKN